MTAQPSPAEGSSNRKRLLFLAGIAAVSVVLAVVAVAQTNLEEQKRQEQSLRPANNMPVASNTTQSKNGASTGDAASTGDSVSTGATGASQAADAAPFPDNPNPDPDFPVTSGSGSKLPASTASQKTGERILSDIAEGAIGSSMKARQGALKKAQAQFRKSIAADARNEAAHYLLAYTNANLTSGYLVTKTKKDDKQVKPLMREALAEGKKSLEIAVADNNPIVTELAKNLIKGITPYVK